MTIAPLANLNVKFKRGRKLNNVGDFKAMNSDGWAYKADTFH